MPSMRSRPKGPKKGKETYFGYSGGHQVHMNLQLSPPPPVATTCQGFYDHCIKNYV